MAITNKQRRIAYGKKLKAARTQRGLTQQQLADAINITRVSIGNYESGSTLPLPSIRDAITKALRVDITIL